MKINKLYDIGTIINKKNFDILNDLNLSEKTQIVSLAIYNMFGGEIYVFLNSYYGSYYCNKIDDRFYNLSFDFAVNTFINCNKVNIDELLNDNKITYYYHKFVIKLIKEYLTFLEDNNNPIKEYLQLVNAIPIYEKLYRQSLLYKDDNSCYSFVIDKVKEIISDMENNFQNIKYYLFLQNKLAKCEKEYEEFKEKLLGKGKRKIK